MLHGIDPLLISCWACLCHDLHSVVAKQTSLSLKELLGCIHAHAQELHAAAALYKKDNVDAGVPIALCPANLVWPILQKHMPDKMQPRPARSQKRTPKEDDSCTTEAPETQRGTASETAQHNAVGSATAEETTPKDAPNAPATPTPSATRRRWTVQALDGSAQPAVTRGDATAKAAAKAAAKRPRMRLRSKTVGSGVASRSNPAGGYKRSKYPRQKKSTAHSSAAKRLKPKSSSSQRRPRPAN